MKVTISARYGSVDSVHGSPHTGVDIAIPQGTPIHSIGEGTVRLVNYGHANIGKGIIVHQNDGTDAIYGHLSGYKVHEGDYVAQGQTIGYSGNTGHTTGPHLHLGLKENGHFIDPTSYANEAINGHARWWHNGHIGDGIGDIPNHNLWGWVAHELSQITIDGITNFLSHFLVALPPLLVVGCGVYFLINMVNKRLAKIGLYGVLAYGCYLVLGGTL
jgi:hypothetical protein